MFLDLIRRAIVLQAAAFLKFSKQSDLSDEVRSIERALNYGRDETARVKTLLEGQKLTCLDLGARDGPIAYMRPYRESCRFILADADPQEAARLREQGYIVVDQLVADHIGEMQLYLTKSPGCSSTLHPSGPMLPFYAGEAARFEVEKTLTLPTTTIDAIQDEHGCIDYLKMDLQGFELEVLRGMRAARPLFIQSEVAIAQLYKNQGTLFDIGTLLGSRGYVSFDIALRRVYPKASACRRNGARDSLGIPLTGDAYFMPDWTSEAGLALIRERPNQWAALMLIHGQHDTLQYVRDVCELKPRFGR